MYVGGYVINSEIVVPTLVINYSIQMIKCIQVKFKLQKQPALITLIIKNAVLK